MGSGSSKKKTTPTILVGFRSEPEPKEIPIPENVSPKTDSPGLNMEDGSDGETVLVTKKEAVEEKEKKEKALEETHEDDEDFVRTVDGYGKGSWPIRCFAKLDFNINAYHGGCASLVLISTSYGGKGEETNVEAFLMSSGFDCNHQKNKSVFRAHEGHFQPENRFTSNENGTLVADCLFGTNHVRVLSNDCRYGNLRNGVFVEGKSDGNPTVLPLDVNGNWNSDAGPGSGLTMVFCSGKDDGNMQSAIYMIKSGFKDNKYLPKLFVGEDKFKFSLQGSNLAVSGPNGSKYSLFHNRNNLSESEKISHSFVSQIQSIDGKTATVLLDEVQGQSCLIVLCSNSNGTEDSTAASMYFIVVADGKLVSAKEVAGLYGKSYKQSDLWTFEVNQGCLEVKGPEGPCKYGIMSNISASKQELLSSIKQTGCIGTGEASKTEGKVKVTNKEIAGEVNKPADIHIMWNHKVIKEIDGKMLKKEGSVYKFSHTWSEDDTVIGLHMIRVFAVRKHTITGEEVYIELDGSPHQLIYKKPGVVYALNCGGQAYQAVNDVVYSSEFSEYANYDFSFYKGNQFKSLGCCKTNALLPNSMLKTSDGFLCTRSRNGHGYGDDGQKVQYKISDIPNGSYIFRLHTNNRSDNMKVNGKEVSSQIREHIAKQRSPTDIDHFACYTIDIDVEVKDGVFKFVTKALDTTFRQSEKVGAFALLDKKKYEEKCKSEAEKKEEVVEKHKLADSVLPLSTSATRKQLTIVGWSPNLLQNASAEAGNMKHWNTRGDFKVASGGYNTEKCIDTSHTWCDKYQEINLLDHFSAKYLDTAPDIQIIEWYKQGNCGGGFYEMNVELLSESGDVISKFSTGQIGSVYKEDWQEASHTFKGYGPGVRMVGFSSRGKDDKFWAGHFGIKMSGAEVRVKRESTPAADDAFTDLDLQDTDSSKVMIDKLVTRVLSDNQELLKDFVEHEIIPVDKEFEKQTEISPDQQSKNPSDVKKRRQRKKREIRVFVSSTFRDFAKEREEIIKKAFRGINMMCADRGVFFTYVDLRWGITSEQTDDGKTIAICLQEIDRCRPYFICMMGDRFGWSQKSGTKDELLDTSFNYAIENHPNMAWVEQYRFDTSVTTLEVFHGVLNNPTAAKDRCFFYMREPVSEDEYTEEEYKRLTSESEWHHEKQSWLKSEVLKHKELNVKRFKKATEVSNLIKSDLERCINEDFPLGTELTKLEQQREAHTAFAEARCRVYIGREDYFTTVNAKRTENLHQPFVLLGESGSGKSAFVANWAKRVEDSEPDTFMFVHFIGSSADSAYYLKLLRRLFEELKTHFGFDMAIPTSDSQLINDLSKWLRMAGSRSKVVIVFDALNQLDDGTGQNGPEHDLLWIPSKVPPNVFILLSTLPGRAMEACKSHGWPSMKVEPLDDPQKAQIITDYLEGIYGKTLNTDQKEMIVAAKQTSNALYLKSLLDEVRMYGSFRTLTDKIREYLTADNPGDLFAKILERLEQDFEKGANSSENSLTDKIFTLKSVLSRPGLVRDATTAIWCSNRGMSEAELTDLLDVKSAVWSPFYLSLYENLVNRDGILNFFHDHLRQAVEKKYLSTAEEKKKGYRKLADFFETRELSMRKVEELPFLLMKAGELDRLKATVSDLDVFFRMSDSEDGIFELVKAWKTLGDFSQSEEAYMNKLSGISKQEKLQNSQHYCKLYSQLGNFFKNLGLMEAAKNIYLTLIEQLQLNYGISHGTIVYSAHNNSWTYRCKHPTVIKSLQELGEVYYKMGQFENAKDTYVDAINRQTRIETPTQKLQLCEGLLGLSAVYMEQENMADAKKLLTRALELSADILGEKHHFVAAVFTKLGQLSYKQGRIDEALAFYLQDLKVTRSEVGTNHPRVATVLNEIALVYDDKNDTIAGQLYEAALAIMLETYGNNYVGTAVIRYNLGAFYFGTNYFSKARYQFEEAYNVLESFLGTDHPDTLAVKEARNTVSP